MQKFLLCLGCVFILLVLAGCCGCGDSEKRMSLSSALNPLVAVGQGETLVFVLDMPSVTDDVSFALCLTNEAGEHYPHAWIQHITAVKNLSCSNGNRVVRWEPKVPSTGNYRAFWRIYAPGAPNTDTPLFMGISGKFFVTVPGQPMVEKIN